MSSLAKEESRSISENVTWGQRKRFSDGKVSIPYGQFLGYRKGADGLPEIVPEEAEIVRRMLLNAKQETSRLLGEDAENRQARQMIMRRRSTEQLKRSHLKTDRCKIER